MYLAIMEVWHFLHAAEEVVRAGVFHSILHQVVREPVSLVSPFFDWSALVGSSVSCLGVALVGFVVSSFWLTNHCDRVIYQ